MMNLCHLQNITLLNDATKLDAIKQFQSPDSLLVNIACNSYRRGFKVTLSPRKIKVGLSNLPKNQIPMKIVKFSLFFLT